MLTIPVGDAEEVPRQVLRTSIGGETIHIALWWSPLPSAWYLSVRTAAGMSLVEGRQIAPFVRLVRNPAFSGEFAVIGKVRDERAEMNRNAWERYDLVYLTPTEVEAVNWPL